jgi:hypothetical protein
MAMNISGAQSTKIKTMLQGAALGFLVAAIGGQFWPGYMLDSSAKAEMDRAVDAANITSASIMCQEIYMNAADSKAKLVAFRALESYRIGQDADVQAASVQAIKLFTDAKVFPEPSSYRVKSECSESLHKPSKAAQL